MGVCGVQITLSCGTTIVPTNVAFVDTNPAKNAYDGARRWCSALRGVIHSKYIHAHALVALFPLVCGQRS